ncbi:hypothetical protein ABD86_21260 [Paenibacillus alvei]|nr:hypothetical protein [Paenibacillus alvei]MBG9746336.1 hypothetical protein [Paenibacillus alvei]
MENRNKLLPGKTEQLVKEVEALPENRPANRRIRMDGSLRCNEGRLSIYRGAPHCIVQAASSLRHLEEMTWLTVQLPRKLSQIRLNVVPIQTLDYFGIEEKL